MNHVTPMNSNRLTAVAPRMPALVAVTATACLLSGWTGGFSAPLGAAETTYSGRLVNQDGQPVVGADIRIHLVHQINGIREDWIQNWQFESDGEGRFQIKGVEHRQGDSWVLRVDIAAPGYVDFEKTLVLDRLPSSPIVKLEDFTLVGGVRLRGRCLGADEQPAAAKVYYLGTFSDRPYRPIQVRPRSTDGSGRFDLIVPSLAKGELLIYPDSWAPQRVAVPTSKSDLGTIRLDHGTKISGSLSDQSGRPLPGYHVLAESKDSGDLPGVNFKVNFVKRTGPRGDFEFPPVKGEFTLRLVTHLALWGRIEEPLYTPRPKPAVNVKRLAIDGREDGVSVSLRVVPAIRIQGTVWTDKGQPAQGQVVSVIGSSADDNGDPEHLNDAVTDSAGHYVLDGIPRGTKNASVFVVAAMRVPGERNALLIAKPVKGDGSLMDGSRWNVAHLDADVDEVNFRYGRNAP
jgi:hypothetical protein